MKLNEEQLKEVYEILREKLLVMRANADGVVNITAGNERYFPEKKNIVLGMPLASSNATLSLNEKPKAISVTFGRKSFKTFSLLPLYEQKKIAGLDVNAEKQKSLIQKYKVKDEQSQIPVLKTFYIHLPYYKNCLNYGEVVTRMTLELYEQFLNKERIKVEEAFADEHFSFSFKTKVGNKLTFNKSHEQYIEKKFFDFLKSFDAFEITNSEDFPLIANYKGFDNFDEKLNYATYMVSFWKFPIAEKPSYKTQKVSNKDAQLLKIKRAVFNKAHVNMDENAALSVLPLISDGKGKDDK